MLLVLLLSKTETDTGIRFSSQDLSPTRDLVQKNES